VTTGRIVRALVLVVAGVALLTALTGFAAGNTVSPSFAGSTKKATGANDIKPTACSAITLATLVVQASGTTTVNGTAGNDLIIGRPVPSGGTDTLNGKGGNDCMVGAGGPGTTNRFNGNGGTDVCIGAPGATNIFTNCETHYN
jgi:Ca2+-binding RTX toxin-like protein